MSLNDKFTVQCRENNELWTNYLEMTYSNWGQFLLHLMLCSMRHSL